MYNTKSYVNHLQDCGFENISISTFEKENVFPAFYDFLIKREQNFGSFVKKSLFIQLKLVILLMKYLSNRAGIDMILVSANKPN